MLVVSLFSLFFCLVILATLLHDLYEHFLAIYCETSVGGVVV